MKLMFFTVFSALWFSLSAQITVTSATFPDAGDTLFTATDNNPLNKVLGGNGGPKDWDFTDLNPESLDTVVFLDASAGSNPSLFPSADLVSVSSQGVESYYEKTADALVLLGFVGADLTGFGLDLPVVFDPPYIVRRAPMDFFDVNQVSTDLSISISLDALPDSLLPGIPGIDSLRFRIHFDRLDVVDSYGDMALASTTHAVLREKRTEYIETNIDIHTFLGWTPIPGGGIGGLGGIDTSEYFHFFSNTQKEEIARVSVDPGQTEALSIDFKYKTPTVSATYSNAPGKASVQAHPNPAFEDVTFECLNLPKNTYTLELFDLVGKTVWEETRDLNGSTKIKLDLEDFSKGTYLYSLKDKEGRNFGTKRLVIIKP